MRKAIMYVLILSSQIAVSQNKTQTRSIAFEPKTGYGYDVLYNKHAGVLNADFVVKFTESHALIFGSGLIYTKAQDTKYWESHWGYTTLRNIHAVFFTLPLNYRVSFGKKKSFGFFETGISLGAMHTWFNVETHETIWYHGVPSGSVPHFNQDKYTNFDFGINNALGYRYNITTSLDFVSAISLNYHTANPYDYFIGSSWGGSLFVSCQVGISYTFKVYQHKWMIKGKKQ